MCAQLVVCIKKLILRPTYVRCLGYIIRIVFKSILSVYILGLVCDRYPHPMRISTEPRRAFVVGKEIFVLNTRLGSFIVSRMP